MVIAYCGYLHTVVGYLAITQNSIVFPWGGGPFRVVITDGLTLDLLELYTRSL